MLDLCGFGRKATSKDGKDGGIELVRPPEGAKPGDRVYFEGADFESKVSHFPIPFSANSSCPSPLQSSCIDAQPLAQLNPKKKIFETIQPGQWIPDLVMFFVMVMLMLILWVLGFTTLETREAAWVNPVTKSAHRIRTKDGVCIAPTFVGASLS